MLSPIGSNVPFVMFSHQGQVTALKVAMPSLLVHSLPELSYSQHLPEWDKMALTALSQKNRNGLTQSPKRKLSSTSLDFELIVPVYNEKI